MNAYVPASLVFGLWAATVALGDCRARRVPNVLVAIGLCAAFAAALLHAGPARIGAAQAGGAAFVGFVALMPFFVLGIMGAGDVKVFAVLGAWCGLHALLDLWIVASLAAGVHAVTVWVALRLRSQAAHTPDAQGGATSRRGAPYAAFLTVPAIAWVVWLNLFVPQFAAGSAR